VARPGRFERRPSRSWSDPRPVDIRFVPADSSPDVWGKLSMPKAWNYALWIQETMVSNTILRGNRKRSDPLDALDRALRAYDDAKKTHNVDQILAALSTLFDKSDAWKATKSDVTKSIRNKNGNFTDFEQWLVAENQKILAPWEPAWGTGSANCYAYAMKCRKDFTETPVPGRHAGYAVVPGDRSFRSEEWAKKAQELHKRSLE
jgi:hypothetical protein